MVVAQILGGPRDGEYVQLDSPHWSYRVAIKDRPFEPYRIISIRPELTKNGWIMRWPKGG